MLCEKLLVLDMLKMIKRIKGKVRKEILSTAVTIFAEKGYEATSVDEIVEKMGIAKGTFYYYFKTKEDVFHEIIDEGVAQLYLLMNASIKKLETKEEKIRKIIEIEIDFFKQYHDFCLVFVGEFWSYKDRWHKDIQKVQEKYMDLINKIFGENNKQKVKGAVLFWLGATMSLHWQTFAPETSRKTFIDDLTEVALRGLLV